MVDGVELEHIVDLEALDPTFLQATIDHRDELAGAKGAAFPEPKRLELYETVADAIARYSPDTRVALCLETPDMIDRLRPRLAMTKRAQVCNCGPRCTSGQLRGTPAVSDSEERLVLRRRKAATPKRLDRASTRRTRRG